MSLIPHQKAFVEDVCKLCAYMNDKGIIFTGGELFRPDFVEQIYFEKGLSKTKTGNHPRRLAIDFNLFQYQTGHLIPLTTKEETKHIGDFWCSLNPLNRWGGNFINLNDIYHFERNVPR